MRVCGLPVRVCVEQTDVIGIARDPRVGMVVTRDIVRDRK